MAEILLIEDNQSIYQALQFAFEAAGYVLKVAPTMAEAYTLVDSGSAGLILLDINLPDGNGFDLYKNRIAGKKIPTIFLTAKDEEEDIVKGLDMGAEDYITKPFSTRELMARVNRILRRTEQKPLLRVQDISYDLDKMEALKNGEKIQFSSLELKIVNLLFANHNKAVKRSDVIDLIWEATGNDVYDHTVTVYMKRIKDKLGTDIIKTIKGVGYRIDC